MFAERLVFSCDILHLSLRETDFPKANHLIQLFFSITDQNFDQSSRAGLVSNTEASFQ